MKTSDRSSLRRRSAAMATFAAMLIQLSAAQSYMNINFTNSSNKYSLITEVKSITFNESGGIVVKKTDNSVTTETLTLIGSITLDETSGGGTPLPVELISFTAVSVFRKIELKWKTAGEVNNYGFEVQRSEVRGQRSENGDQRSDVWMKIGFIEGTGTTNSAKEYSFTDRRQNTGTYSYRLKQIDRSGNYAYSDAVEVTSAGGPAVFALEQNYPNPFNPTTEISYQLSAVSQTSLIIFDAIGREVAVLVNEEKEAGYHTATFDASTLASGIYFAKLQSGEKVQLKKMLLMK